MRENPGPEDSNLDPNECASRLVLNLDEGKAISDPILFCVSELLAAPYEDRQGKLETYSGKLSPQEPSDQNAVVLIYHLVKGREPSRGITKLLQEALIDRLKEKCNIPEDNTSPDASKTLEEEDYILCRHKPPHKNHIKLNVLCDQCHTTLFKLRWWYHVIFLHISLLAIGFAIGRNEPLWIPIVIVELLFVIYIAILFRAADIGWQIFVVSMVVVTFLIVFIQTEGNFSQSSLDTTKVICLSVSVAFFFIAFAVAWWNESFYYSDYEFFESLPALATGWFFITLFLDILDDSYFHILSPQIRLTVQRQIYLREILYGLSIICYVILAVVRTTKQQITAPKEFFEPEITVTGWQSQSTQFLLLVIFQAIGNTILSILKWIGEIAIACINFFVYLITLAAKWIGYFFLELFNLLKSFFQLLFLAFFSFCRDSVIPFFLLCGLNYALIVLTRYLYVYINDETRHWTSMEIKEIVILFLAIHPVTMLFVWMVPGHWIKLRDCVRSISLTNVAFTLLIAAYVMVSSWELYGLSRYILPSLPFKNIGFFTRYLPLGFAGIGLLAIIANKFNSRRSQS